MSSIQLSVFNISNSIFLEYGEIIRKQGFKGFYRNLPHKHLFMWTEITKSNSSASVSVHSYCTLNYSMNFAMGV